MKSIEYLRKRCTDEFCIAASEDYDNCRWIWFPKMSKSELENYWLKQTQLDWSPNTLLDGEWVKEPDDEQAYTQFLDIYIELWCRKGTYALHYDGDCSAALFTPDGRALFHAGHDEAHQESFRKSAKRRTEG